jgi:hypothetical protein
MDELARISGKIWTRDTYRKVPPDMRRNMPMTMSIDTFFVKERK